MLTEDEWIQITTRVVRLTNAGSITWQVLQPDVEHDPTYKVRINELTEYRVWSRDGDGRVPLRFNIMRASVPGEAMQAVDSFMTKEFEVGDASASDWILDVYNAAARSASGSPQLVAKLLAELDDLDPGAMPF
jgi:hypothetical protein